MRHAHKLVAATLLAAMLLMPLLAVALCVDTAATANCCQRGCPMSRMTAHTRSHYNGPQSTENTTRNCCAIKKSNPAPLTESQVVAPVLIALAPVAEATLPLTGLDDAVVTCDTSPPQSQSQARLCTFRI
jgi:hypothetical protein